MGKLFFTLISALMLLSISSTTYASSEPQKQSAKEKREQRKAAQAAADSAYAKIVEEALKEGSFTFSADYFSAGSIIRQPLTAIYSTMVVTPKFLDVKFPYITTTRSTDTTPLVIDFQTLEFKYSSEVIKGIHHVKITVNGVRNNQSALKVQNGTYVFEFQIWPDGNTILTLTPNYMAHMIFYGTIAGNRQ